MLDRPKWPGRAGVSFSPRSMAEGWFLGDAGMTVYGATAAQRFEARRTRRVSSCRPSVLLRLCWFCHEIRHSGTQAVRRRAQGVSAGRPRQGEGVSLPVHRGHLPPCVRSSANTCLLRSLRACQINSWRNRRGPGGR